MSVHHRLDGPADAPVIVLSSSLGTTLEMWDAQVAPLSEVFRVLRYDRRGHGRSPVEEGPYAIDDLAGDVLELLDRLGIARVAFCGLSLGGCEGMWLAARSPARIERLVLCCTDPSFGPPEPWRERAETVLSEGMAAIADAALGRWFTPSFHAGRPDVVARFREMLVATPADGYAACCEAIATLNLWPDLAAITAPTLVISGAHDPVATPEAGERLAASVAGAHMEVIAGAAHLANVEQPEAFNEAVLGFISAGTREVAT